MTFWKTLVTVAFLSSLIFPTPGAMLLTLDAAVFSTFRFWIELEIVDIWLTFLSAVEIYAPTPAPIPAGSAGT